MNKILKNISTINLINLATSSITTIVFINHAISILDQKDTEIFFLIISLQSIILIIHSPYLNLVILGSPKRATWQLGLFNSSFFSLFFLIYFLFENKFSNFNIPIVIIFLIILNLHSAAISVLKGNLMTQNYWIGILILTIIESSIRCTYILLPETIIPKDLTSFICLFILSPILSFIIFICLHRKDYLRIYRLYIPFNFITAGRQYVETSAFSIGLHFIITFSPNIISLFGSASSTEIVHISLLLYLIRIPITILSVINSQLLIKLLKDERRIKNGTNLIYFIMSYFKKFKYIWIVFFYLVCVLYFHI